MKIFQVLINVVMAVLLLLVLVQMTKLVTQQGRLVTIIEKYDYQVEFEYES
jgi:hypothetical protein